MPYIIDLLHQYLSSCGSTKLYFTIKGYFYSKNLSREFHKVVSKCFDYQIEKQTPVKYGLIHKSLQSASPLETIATDIVGNYKANEIKGELSKENVWFLTIFDTCTRFTKVYLLYEITSNKVIKYFKGWIDDIEETNF